MWYIQIRLSVCLYLVGFHFIYWFLVCNTAIALFRTHTFLLYAMMFRHSISSFSLNRRTSTFQSIEWKNILVFIFFFSDVLIHLLIFCNWNAITYKYLSEDIIYLNKLLCLFWFEKKKKLESLRLILKLEGNNAVWFKHFCK